MLIKQLKKELGLSDKEIAEFFGLKNMHTYRNSSAKKRYEEALCNFYSFLEGRKIKQKEQPTKDNTSANV